MLPAAENRRELTGKRKPRIAPPVPVKTNLAEYEKAAADLRITLQPWQKLAARYVMAIDADARPLFREVCIIAPRRNGKTTLLKPRILLALRQAQQVIHTAQDGSLPSETFLELADELEGHPDVRRIRRQNGKESITFRNGGRYTVLAPTHGIRGRNAHLIILDEIREQKDERLMSAILPTMATNADAQAIYLSNAGHDESIVLNNLRKRGLSGDPGRLAYLEWSASPDGPIDDPATWAEANPALGHTLTVARLVELRQSMSDAAFETEHLCRWVSSMRERLVFEADWGLCEAIKLPAPTKVYLGVSMDPDGTRAAAAVAWQSADGRLSLRQTHDVTGSPIDPIAFGRQLRKDATTWGVVSVGFDPMTDAGVAKFFPVKAAMSSGNKLANATSTFVTAVQGQRLRWHDAPGVTADLSWTARKRNDERGSFQAVRMSDDRPIPAALAAIYAVELASGPQLVGRPMIG